VKKLALIMLPLSFGGFAYADDQKELFSVFGGEVRCQQIVTDLNSRNQLTEIIMINTVKYYTEGFLSSYNVLKYALGPNKPQSLLGDGLTGDFIINYVKDYCLHHPSTSLPLAVTALLQDLQRKP